jgi:uncharacterized protein YoxC
VFKVIVILYVSVAVIAVAFLILALSVSRTLRSVDSTLNSVSKMLDGLENQLKGVTQETAELLHKTNELAENIGEKTKELNSVVYAVKGIGSSIETFNQSLKKITTTVGSQLEKNQNKISQVVQWSQVVKQVLDKWKRKEESPAAQTQNNTVSESRGSIERARN